MTAQGDIPVIPDEYADADELHARGRALAAETPPDVHDDHGVAAAGRPSVVDYIEQTHADRLPDLLPLRLARMSTDPFAFFRGTAGLMAADLAASPASGLDAQICGDAHAANFGLYGTSDGDVVMDINDFDETVVGPWEWDLKRLATSLVLAGRVGGVSEAKARDAAEDAVKAYRRTVRDLVEQPYLSAWTALADDAALSRAKADDLTKDFRKAVEKARRNTSERVVAKAVEHIDDHATGVRRHQFIEQQPVLWHLDDAAERQVMTGVQDYVGSLRSRGTP